MKTKYSNTQKFLNKQYHRKVLLCSFNLNGHTLGFHPDSKVRKVVLSSFYLNGNTIGFHPQTQKLQPPCTA